MLKKLILLLGCVGLFVLVACGGEGGSAMTAEPVSDGFRFSIESINDDEFADLEDYDEVNYAIVRDIFITEGLNLRFDFNQPVTDFSIIDVVILEDGSFAKTDVLYEVGNLYPDRPLIITHYFGAIAWQTLGWNHEIDLLVGADFEIDSDLPNLEDVEGMMPEIDPIIPDNVIIPDFGYGSMSISGFYFTSPDGEGQWYILGQNQIDGTIIWYPFDWSHERDLFVVDENFEVDPSLPTLEDIEGMMPEVDPIIPVDIRVVDSDEELQNYFEFDYAEVRGEEAPPNTYTLLITLSELMPPEEPLRDFNVISINHDNETPEVTGVLFHVGDLRSDKPLLIHSYFGDGTLPTSGFSFGYPRRYFMFTENQSGSETGRFIVTELTNVPSD